MAEPATSTIALPMPGGKKINVPKWGIVAGVGGLAAIFLFMKNKGAATATDATAAGDQAATDAAGGADLLSYIQDLFAQLQGLGAPGEDITVTPTQRNRNPTPNVSVDQAPQPTLQITPSSYVAAFRTPQYVAAGVGASGTTPQVGTSGYTGGHPSFAWPTYTPPPKPVTSNTSGYTGGHPSFSSPAAPIVQTPTHGVQQ